MHLKCLDFVLQVITDEAEEEGEEEVAEEVTWEEVETLYLIRAIQFT